MFGIQQPGMTPGTHIDKTGPACIPLERLETEICELAGHLAAATCRFLILLGDFDARRGWASWDMNSCAQWMSWKCQMASGTAREHVRIARALRTLPVIRGEFTAGRLSFSKVRALTRIATEQTEEGLVEIAGPMTANQLERFARAHREVSRADDAQARMRRRLAWRFEEDGSLSGTFHLPPLEGAALLKALRAATGDLDHSHDVSAETDEAVRPTSSTLGDALVEVAEAYLAGKVATASNPDIYQVIVHVGTDALDAGDVSAETPPDTRRAEPSADDPADPARSHVEDGPAVSVSTAAMLACNSTLSWMLHDHDGTLLDVGRRHRRPTAALRRAARERDLGRCRYPGCESRKVDLHHILYWRYGGETKLVNLISLCKHHHRLVHEGGILIATVPGGSFAFLTADGEPVAACHALPRITGGIEDRHDAQIAPGTIIPAWYGERLDLDYAIAVCFANAESHARKEAVQEPEAWRPAANDMYAPDPLQELRAIRV
jgi:hypothetical protein